ncbi:hypothetical protein Cfor_05105 [Coptotermes formosanus]|uniref:Peptidase C1A papain C-terminal domain-containing protein n=1 Tax=Coptotermes formosanus TaxID=36987 RepID=A0A6L2PMX6_COPFO|nr:hypothetical protein Cfor_05105 [Coptotermes formosanus]
MGQVPPDEAGLGLAIAFVQGALITAYEDNCPLKFGRKGKWSLRWTSKLESLRREIRRLKLKLKTVSQGFYFFGIRESNSARSDERRVWRGFLVLKATPKCVCLKIFEIWFPKMKTIISKLCEALHTKLAAVLRDMEKEWVDFKLDHEFVRAMNVFRGNGSGMNESNMVGPTHSSPASEELPDEVDWRQNGAVTAVRNQKDCNSCWAFSATKHGKKYEPAEDEDRRKIFTRNMKYIMTHNAAYERGEVSSKLAMNRFGDMLDHEFVRAMNVFRGYGSGTNGSNTVGPTLSSPASEALPDEVDWRDKGAVTAVKNQKDCHSCWAFSATGALEGQHFIKNGVLIPLSEQNLIDCSGGKYGNKGCDYGYVNKAFEYVMENKGIATEDDYPYEAAVGECRYEPHTSGATAAGCVPIVEANELKLQEAVAKIGPISVVIDASDRSFQYHKEGVYCGPKCEPSKMRHAVLVVGYGTDKFTDKEYWLVKNSWGTGWGEDGYIRMARNQDNRCCIASSASYPKVDKS